MGVDDAGAVRANLQNALDVAEALGLRSGDVDFLDELGLLLAGRLDLELLSLLAQLSDLHGREFLARKRGLGGSGITLLVALFAIALAVATVVVAVVLTLVALVVALVLATVGTSAVFALSGGGTIGCGGANIGRGGVIGLGARINLRFDILLLGRLGLNGLLTTALGLLGRRLFDVLGLGDISRRIGGRLGRILGRTLLGSLGLGRALSSSTTAATGTDVGGLGIGGSGRKAGSTTGTSLASTGAAGSTGNVPSPAAERTEASVSSGATCSATCSALAAVRRRVRGAGFSVGRSAAGVSMAAGVSGTDGAASSVRAAASRSAARRRARTT